MKIPEFNGPATITSNDFDVVDIEIGTSREAQIMVMKVLTDTLYTDKESAVWREYGVNGMDANVEAGRGNIPIEITLPSRVLPEAIVRDFGYGMTEAMMRDVYAKLGESTKRNSNAVTGMIGIGAKAGYAYGAMFTVTSFNGGLKTIYQFFRDEGIPRMAKLAQEPSDAPDGTEIRVPVMHAHVDDFREKAERVFRYFLVRPIVHGGALDYKRTHAVFHGADWRLTCDGKSVAVMGNVGYGINKDSLGVTDPAILNLLGLGIEIDFAIGELEIAANRESLQYRELTRSAVITKTKRILCEVAQIFVGQISSATCLWDAKKGYGEAFEQMGGSEKQALRTLIDDKVTWQGKPINSGRFMLESTVPNRPASVRPGNTVCSYTRGIWDRRSVSRNLSPSWVMPSADVVLCINDIPSRAVSPARLRGFFQTNLNATLVVFNFPNTKVQTDYWTEFELDGAPTINLSSLLPTYTTSIGAPAVSTHRAKHSAQAFTLDENGSTSKYENRTASTRWDVCDVDADNGTGVYVELEKFGVWRTGGVPIWPWDLIEQVTSLRTLQLLDGPVYGFKRKDAPRKLGAGWVSLEKTVQSKVEEIYKAHAQEIADYFEAMQHAALLPFALAAQLPDCLAKHYIEAVKRMRARPHAAVEAIRCSDLRTWLPAEWLATGLPVLPAATVDLAALGASVLTLYPMFTFYDAQDGRARNSLTALADYVLLISK